MDLDFLYMESFSRLMRPHLGKPVILKTNDGEQVEGTLWIASARRSRSNEGEVAGEPEAWVQILKTNSRMGHSITFPLRHIQSVFQDDRGSNIFLGDKKYGDIGIIIFPLSKKKPWYRFW